MAKQRYINTKFWDDSYIVTLDPIEKLIFLYFLTNPLTNICGVYEISLNRIAFDTGIDKETVLKILGKFETEEKMLYRNGWLAIKNFIKNQAGNPKIARGIELELEKVPKNLKSFTLAVSDTAYIEPDSLSHTNSNSNTNSNTNSKLDELQQQFFRNPLFEQIKEQYPDRNYTYQFGLMCDWWLTERKKLPQNISTFSNWLARTQPDPAMTEARTEKVRKDHNNKLQDNIKPLKPETLAKFREGFEQTMKNKTP